MENTKEKKEVKCTVSTFFSWPIKPKVHNDPLARKDFGRVHWVSFKGQYKQNITLILWTVTVTLDTFPNLWTILTPSHKHSSDACKIFMQKITLINSLINVFFWSGSGWIQSIFQKDWALSRNIPWMRENWEMHVDTLYMCSITPPKLFVYIVFTLFIAIEASNA